MKCVVLRAAEDGETMLTSPGVKASSCLSTALALCTPLQRIKDQVAAWEGRRGPEGRCDWRGG